MLTAYMIAIASAAMGQTASLTHDLTLTQDLQAPARIATIPGGGIYVTDQLTDAVVEFDAAGNHVATYSVNGPVGIAVGAAGIFVSHTDGTVGVYDSTFTPVAPTTLNPGPVTMTAPNGIAVDNGAGEVYVVDSAEHMVIVFDQATGGFLQAWGTQGTGLAEFQSPQAVALDPVLGHVIVADTDNFRVQVFDTAGLLQYKFGYRTLFAPSGSVAWFARCEGLAVDDCGNIYITDALMGTIRAFDAMGQELDADFLPLVEYGPSPGLQIPIDIAIDGTKAYVSSNYNGSVEVYDLTCAAPPLPMISASPVLNNPDAHLVGVRKGRSSLKVEFPDNPFDIAHAIENGTYQAAFDLNDDRQVDITDLELAIERFGAGTINDFLSGPLAAYPEPLQPPHMVPGLAYICGRCHSMEGLPGGMLSVDGQENLCRSCHSAGAIAMNETIDNIDTGMNHPIGIPADQGGSHGPDPDSFTEIAFHLDNGDIRCGTCHNPHNSDAGEPFVRAGYRQAKLCGECHPEADEWMHAGHADEHADPFSHYDWAQAGRAGCRRCHSGFGYIDFTEGAVEEDQRGDFRVLDCQVCHATHGKPQDEELLRLFGDVEMPWGTPMAGLDQNATCVACHNGRYEPGTGHLTPHYLLGGVMLPGINGIDFGATLSNSAHSAVASCTGCHMAPSPATGDGAGKVGGHSFNMVVHDPGATDDGFENVDNACNAAACHGGTGALTEFNRLAYGDYDGNGLVEGVQDEVQGLLDLVLAEIEGLGAVYLGGYPYWSLPKVCIGGIDDGDPCTVNGDCDDVVAGDGLGTCGPGANDALLRDAIWNYEYVENDGSLGIHNTSYAVGLLQATYEALAGDAVPDADLRYIPAGLSETVIAIQSVNNGDPVEPGGAFTVDFTIEDEFGSPLSIGTLDRLRLYVSGPATNYQIVIPSDSNMAHFAQNPDDSYTYTAVAPFPTVYSAPLNDSPDLTEGELTGQPLLDGTYTVLIESRRTFGNIRKAGDATFDFVVANDPFNPPTLDSRQLVLLDSCNECHNNLQLHGGGRFSVTGCVLCHTNGAEDLITTVPSTPGVTIQFGDMIHKIHRGQSLRYVEATASGADPYRYIIRGHNESTHDFSDIGFPIMPMGIIDCDACHGGATDAAQIYANPTRAGCGGCHDDLDFGTGTILDLTVPEICLGGPNDGLPCTGDSDCEQMGTCSVTATTSCTVDSDCPVGETCVGYVPGDCGPDPAERYAGLGTLLETDLSNTDYRAYPGHANGIGGTDHSAVSDGFCAGCHAPGEDEDSLVAHQHPTVPDQEGTEPAIEIVAVGGMTGGTGTYFVPGDFPEVTFRLMDNTANPLALIPGDTSVLDRLEIALAGPTTLYQQIIAPLRPWSNGNLAVAPANWVDNFGVDGTYTFTFTAAIPANYPAQENSLGEPPAEQIFDYAGGWGQQYSPGGTPLDAGTYTILAWGRRLTPVSGEREPYTSDQFDIPLGTSDPLVPYAGTVTSEKCNACHGKLALHGNQREGVRTCMACHNAGAQDGGTYESVDLRIMVHKLHNARNLTNLPYQMAGHGGIADFSTLLISSMPGEAAECAVCHANDDWKVPPTRNNMRTWSTVCTSCHDSAATRTHADIMTDSGTFNEHCMNCHGPGSVFDVEAVHASP